MTLQQILGQELYQQVQEKLTEVNRNREENTPELRLAEVSAGDFVPREAYQQLEVRQGELQRQLEQTRLDYALRSALTAAGALDVDYLCFKLQEEGQTLELDDRGEIRDWESRLTQLKTRLPRQFEDLSGGGSFQGYRPMPEGAGGEGEILTRSEILKKPYHQRLALYEKDPRGFLEACGTGSGR